MFILNRIPKLTRESLNHYLYLRACLNESLRLSPVAIGTVYSINWASSSIEWI